MTTPFEDSRYSVAHAKKRIKELESEIAAFFVTRPYAPVTDSDPNTGEDVHKIKLVQPMPGGVRGTAFDAVGNLRAALDQTGHAIGVLNGTNGKNAKFPFGDTEAETKSRIKGPSKNIPQKIFDVMLSFKPYKGGNDLLWAVNKAANSHKHEIVFPIAIATGSIKVNRIVLGASGGDVLFPMWDRAKQEMEVVRTPRGAAPDIDMTISTFIAFGDIQGVASKPVVGVLNAMAGEVERVCVAIEAEATRLKLIS